MSKRLLGEMAAAQAEAFVRDWGITDLPVDPFKIADKHDITVMAKPTDAPGVSGILVRRGEQFGIVYATHIKSDGFIRFTVAHELGHYFLEGHPERLFPNGDGQHFSKSGFVCHEECEVEADHFASALLMPESLFIPAMRKAGTGFPAIEQLAAQCRTSITATAIRYACFAEDPVAVVVSTGRKIEFCFMSPPLKDFRRLRWLKKGDPLPARSETGQFNLDDTNVRLARQAEGWTSLDLWFDDAPEVEMKEDVVGLGGYGKTLTVLFTEEALDESGDDDDQEEDD